MERDKKRAERENSWIQGLETTGNIIGGEEEKQMIGLNWSVWREEHRLRRYFLMQEAFERKRLLSPVFILDLSTYDA